MRFSNTLTIESSAATHRWSCAACHHPLGEAGTNWKQAATLIERPADELGGPFGTGRDLLLRQFTCPGCSALLDTEMALSGDPWLDDHFLIQGA